jgi:Uncharacterized conserved protein (DUF2285)
MIACRLDLAMFGLFDHGHQRCVVGRGCSMKRPPLDPEVADLAPSDPVLTVYDEEHIITYLRMLDADEDGADWRDVSRLVLHIDPVREADRARRAFDSHLSRARWMTQEGYRHLLRGGAL